MALSGDIKTFGDLPGMDGFPVGIRHPREEGALVATIDLKNEAISTAGDYERYFEQDGIRYHHILDPQSLQPARKCQSVTVIATEGTMADGLDTGIFVLGPERGMALARHVEGVKLRAEQTAADPASNIKRAARRAFTFAPASIPFQYLSISDYHGHVAAKF